MHLAADKNGGRVRIVESMRDWSPKYLDVVAALFVMTVMVSNLGAAKLFSLGPAIFPAGILVFPLSYIFGDVLTEVYGFNRARRVVYLGLLANVFMAGVLWIAIQLPPAPTWNLQHEFAAVHGLAPRIVIASICGYVGGELANSFVMSRLKLRTKGRFLWVRTISSTLVGQLVDTSVFMLIAFGGVFPGETLAQAAGWAWAFKVSYEIVATPLTYVLVGRLKRSEGVDHFDVKDRLAVFKL